MGERQRQEALGIGLVFLGLLLVLSVISPLLIEPPTNLIGPAGAALQRGGSAAFGLAAVLVAVPAFGWGVHLVHAISRETAWRATSLALGLLILVPIAHWLLATGEDTVESVGWWGGIAGAVLVTVFGRFGTALVLIGLAVVLMVGTLGISTPAALRSAGSWAQQGVRGVARGSVWLWRTATDAFRGSADPLASTPWEDADLGSDDADAGADELLPEEDVARAEAEPVAPSGPALFDPGDLSETELTPIYLLDEPVRRSAGLEKQELKSLGDILVDKLATFRIDGRIGGWTTGPVVTQFEVVPAAGVKVGQIAARADDLALALRAPSVRIVAPIPGKGAVGVEVPNPEPEIVSLRDVLESAAFRRSRATLPLALGRDLSGRPRCADLTRMPHLLIAGATGTGKSVCINSVITSLVFRYSPSELRMLMIDPKMVELSVYNDLPHLRHPVVTDNEDAASVFKWAVYEMRRRFGLLSANACRNVGEFNRRVREGREMVAARPRLSPAGEELDVRLYEEGQLPYVVLLIDELADLIMTVQAEVETPLAMLAQKARAVGIHLVVATQRPSVNVITGLIKANFPSRIAFRVASKTDSRTILDQNGAESLLGNGDMLFLPPGEADPVRIQGAFVSSDETERLLDWYRERAVAREAEAGEERDILEVVRELEEEETRVDVAEDVLADRDELFRQAAEIVITNEAGSTSLLQRRLKIGYGRAARIIDQLHDAGIVGPADGSKPRDVLLRLQDLDGFLADE
jgi:S-DNA-T family DNA segregation ATPase FtsK/SpoIIIE